MARRKINKKTGQIVDAEKTPELANKLGATEEFNPAPQKTFTIGGKTFTNKAEYETAKSLAGVPTKKGAGKITPQAEEAAKAFKTQEEQSIAQKLIDQAERAKRIEDIIVQKTEEKQKEEVQPEAATEVPEVAAAVPEVAETELSDREFLSPTNPAQVVATALGKGQQVTIKQGVKDIGTAAISAVAQVYDFIYSLTQGGKGIEQKEAEQTIEKVESELNEDLRLVSLGLKDYTAVRNKIALAESAINRLERSEKGLSGINLRRFLLDGKDVQARLIIARENLDDFKIQLEVARRKGILADVGSV